MSCVIAVRNEVDTIAAAVRSCLQQGQPGTIEVVVADARSTDGTRQVVTALAAADHRVRLVDNPKRVTPAGLNAAIAASRGEVIVRCDAHAVLPPGYVATALATLERTGAVNVGGVQHAVGDRAMSRAIAMAMSSPLGVGDARFHYGGAAGVVDTVYLGVFPRWAVEQAGGYDETMIRNQDYELNHRLRLAGGTVWFEPRLVVDYRPRSSLRALWRQYYGYGVGKRIMLRRHPRSLRLRQVAAPALVVGLAGSAATATAGARRLGAVAPGGYGVALLAAAAVALLRTRDAAALLVPAAVATMHLAWGCGFLVESGRGRRGQSAA